MKTRKTSFKKIISALLCCSLVMQFGWQLAGIRVNAATTLAVQNTEIGPVITLTADMPDNPVYIVSDVNGYRISCEDDGFEDQVFSEIGMITIEGAVELRIMTDIKTEIEMGEAAAQVYVEPGKTFECDNLYARGGTFYNYGTIKSNVFIAQSLTESDSAFSFINSGTIEAATINLSYAPSGFSSSPNAEYIASSSFTNGSEALAGTVVADRGTVIVNYGGTFTLQVDGAETIVDSYLENKSAYALFDDANVTLDDVPDICVGETPDFSSLIHTAAGYEGTPYIEYSRSATTGYSIELPTSAGQYYVRAHAPSSGSYLEDYSDAQLFDIKYLDVSEQFSDGNYFTFENVVDGRYVNGDVKVVPLSDAYQISFMGERFADYAMVSEEDVLVDGHLNEPYIMFKLKDKDSGAETDNLYVTSSMSANFEDLVFDTDEPYFFINDEEPYAVENGDVIMAYNPAITVEDTTLASVTDGENTYTEINGNDDNKLETTIRLTTTPGTSQEVTLTATDKFNKTTTVTFTIKSPELGDVDASVSIPGTVFVDDEYEPVVTVTGTDEPYTAEFLYDGEEEDQPTSAGNHKVMAILSFDGYDDTIETDEYEYYIYRHEFAPSVSVENITVGGEISPVLSGLPQDYDGEDDPVFEYKLSTASDSSYSTVIPEAAGSYTLRVSFAETDSYSAATCTADFTISKIELTAEVSVEDILVGGTVSPVVTKPDDYDGTITYEYKPSTSDDDAYTAEVPSAAGEYTVRATLPDTAKYIGTTCTGTFAISRKTLTASVSVEDIVAGNTPSPVLTKPNDYDGTITYEYKLRTSDDDAYTTDVPTAGGDYTVRATLASTAVYQGTTCTALFTISKIPVTATVYIDNCTPYYPYSPYMEIDPEAYDGNIIYEYKLSTDPDTAYSTTRPTAIGSYTVRATLEPTDIYEGTTCEDTFNIFKVTVDAETFTSNIYLGDRPEVDVEITSSNYDGHITYEYKLVSEPDSAYTTDLPAQAGMFNVRVTLPETDMYYGTTLTDSFEVYKAETDAYLTVNDIYVGEAVVPELDTDPDGYDGTPVYEYKLSADPDTAYSTTVPTAAGTYTARVTLPETANFESDTDTDTFTISRKDLTAEVSVNDILVGGTIRPVVTKPDDYDGAVTYEYKLRTAGDDAYSAEVPSAGGDYTLRVTFASTDVYLGTTRTADFTINKIMPSASVTVADITIGETVSPVLTTTSDGKNDAVFEYKAAGAADSTYTTTVPTAAGTYTVRATVPETDAYLGISCTYDFKINKIVATAGVSVADITVGGTVTPVLTTNSDGSSKAVFEYKASDAPDAAYSEAVPSAAGTYEVRVTIPETANYTGIICSGIFKIDLNEATLDITVDDIYYGQKPDPSFSTNSNGAVVIMYKSSDAPDSTYTTVAPVDVGNYVARATVSETGIYARNSAFAEFTISYLTAPKTAYTFSGTEGNNGFFTSDVELIAPDGYLISDSLGGEYAESIPYSGELNAVYLKRISDGALTSSVAIGETDRPKIDKDAPVFNTSSGSIADGSVVYVSKLDVIANDPNLRSLTVNGKPVDLSAAGNILSLDPGYGYIEYTIVAEDEAGNITTFKFILMAEWRREGILPPDVVLPLFVEETYKLDTGTWTVNDDTTVYNGGMPVYVNEDGDYTFTKVS